MSKEEKGAQAPEPERGESLYVNEVALVGHCDEAPKAEKTASGKLRAAFGMTVPRGRERLLVRVVAWDAAAERCARAEKGGLVRIEGRLRSWQREKGQPIQIEVVAQVVQLLDTAPRQEEPAAA